MYLGIRALDNIIGRKFVTKSDQKLSIE